MNIEKNALLVEGREDENFVKNLLSAHHLNFHLQFHGKQGYPHLRKTIPTLVKESGIKNLGVIADANSDFNTKWQSISDALKQSDYLVNKPNQNGTILTHVDPIYPKIGIWIMPNNQDNGMLEDFAIKMIPENESLYAYANQCVERLPEIRFKTSYQRKVLIHTWLAWQKEPGTSLGLAVTRDYLKKDTPHATALIQWLKNLFE